MSVIPTTATVPGATAVASGSPSGGKTGAGATPNVGPHLGDVFAALVDALGTELDGATGLEGEALAAGATGEATAETGADEAVAKVPAEVTTDAAVAAVALTIGLPWSPAPPPAPASSGEAGGAGTVAVVPAAPAALPAGAALDAPAQTASTPLEQPAASVTTPGPDGAVQAPALTDAPDASGDGGDAVGPAAAPASADVEAPAVASDASPSTGTGSGPTPSPAGPVAGSPATGATTEVAARAQPTRTPPPALPEQLVEVVAPLRTGPDGTHRVALQLRPDELGEVLVDVRIRGNEVSLNLRADLPATTNLLRDVLVNLRSELEAAGFQSGALDVSAHAGGRQARERKDVPPTGRQDAGSTVGGDADPVGPRRPTTTSTTGLDVRI